jgi:hypothetical protein
MRAFHIDAYIRFQYNGETVEGFVTSQDKDTIYVDYKPYSKSVGKKAQLRYYLLKAQKGNATKTINSTFRTRTTEMIDKMYFTAVKTDPNRRIFITEMFL